MDEVTDQYNEIDADALIDAIINRHEAGDDANALMPDLFMMLLNNLTLTEFNDDGEEVEQPEKLNKLKEAVRSYFQYNQPNYERLKEDLRRVVLAYSQFMQNYQHMKSETDAFLQHVIDEHKIELTPFEGTFVFIDHIKERVNENTMHIEANENDQIMISDYHGDNVEPVEIKAPSFLDNLLKAVQEQLDHTATMKTLPSYFRSKTPPVLVNIRNPVADEGQEEVTH